MNYRTIVFFLLVLSEFTSHAHIVESIRMSDLLTYLDGDTSGVLIIFDIDNTIAEPCCELGSDQWFAHHCVKKMGEGLTYEQAIQVTAPIYHAIQHRIGLKAVEPYTPKLIATLQERGIAMIGLTMRSMDLADRTIKQLHHLEIDFTLSAPHDAHINLATAFPTLFKQGIIFSNCRAKDLALLAFFKHIDYMPRTIIFIDDKLINLKEVEKAVTALGIEFIGIRYGHVDHKVHNFDHAAAEKQLEEFLAMHPIPVQ